MTRRFPGLVIADWRTRLVHDHPRVFPDARLVEGRDGPTLACSGWPDIPDGWRAIVETACGRLDAAVAAEPDAELVVLDMKEKYGSLRLSISAYAISPEANDRATLAVDLAEARSIHVCDVCGAPGRLWERGGWYAARCEEHAEGHVQVPARDPGLQVITRYVDGQPVRSARRYVVASDSFVPAPVPDEEE